VALSLGDARARAAKVKDRLADRDQCLFVATSFASARDPEPSVLEHRSARAAHANRRAVIEDVTPAAVEREDRAPCVVDTNEVARGEPLHDADVDLRARAAVTKTPERTRSTRATLTSMAGPRWHPPSATMATDEVAMAVANMPERILAVCMQSSNRSTRGA
jgi:hypothetical protein